MASISTIDVPELMPLSGKRVLVLGLGLWGGGIGATKFCSGQGAHVTVTDKKTKWELQESVEQIQDLPNLSYRFGGHENLDFGAFDLAVVSPAVPKDSLPMQELKRRHVPITSEMNLFMARCPGKVVGVTGSNGKTTTTHLIAHLLAAGKRRVWLGGNLGRSLLDVLDQIASDDAVVLELSSFQLDDLHRLKRSPNVAVITSLTPNHLDRHKTFEHYKASKSAIFAYQTPKDICILNFDDPQVIQLESQVPGRVACYSHQFRVTPGAYLDKGDFMLNLVPGGGGKSEKRIAPVTALKLAGPYNRLNAMAAIVAAAVLGTPPAAIGKQLRTFEAVEHRLEECDTIDDVTFYNDSVSTTPESTIAALKAFPRRRTWFILGGSDKGCDYTELAHELAKSRCVGVIGIGAIGEDILSICNDAFQRTPDANTKRVYYARTVEGALHYLSEYTRPAEVVLFSPATASFDQFDNFDHRGKTFKSLLADWRREAAREHVPAGMVPPRQPDRTPTREHASQEYVPSVGTEVIHGSDFTPAMSFGDGTDAAAPEAGMLEPPALMFEDAAGADGYVDEGLTELAFDAGMDAAPPAWARNEADVIPPEDQATLLNLDRSAQDEMLGTSVDDGFIEDEPTVTDFAPKTSFDGPETQFSEPGGANYDETAQPGDLNWVDESLLAKAAFSEGLGDDFSGVDDPDGFGGGDPSLAAAFSEDFDSQAAPPDHGQDMFGASSTPFIDPNLQSYRFEDDSEPFAKPAPDGTDTPPDEADENWDNGF